MDFRKAHLGDISELSELRILMLNEEKEYNNKFNSLLFDNTLEYLKTGIINGDIDIYVAEELDEIVGMGCINYFSLPPNDWCPSGKTAYIGNMYTKITFRRKGIANKIIGLLVEQAKNRKCERILLNTSDEGKDLYLKCGFDYSPTAMAMYPFGIIPEIPE